MVKKSPNEWSAASQDQLQAWFLKITGKSKDLVELSNGVTYCQLLALLFPNFLNKAKIQLKPSCQAEKVINWMVIHKTLKILKVDRKIDVVARSRPFDSANLDFCRWFVEFYEENNDPSAFGYAIWLNGQFQHPRIVMDAYRVEKAIDRCFIDRKSYSNGDELRYNDNILFEKWEYELVKDQLHKWTTGREILNIFSVQEPEEITKEMIEHWKNGQMTQNSQKFKEIPSIWDYNPRGIPKEFMNLDPSSFLVDSSSVNICFLPTDVLSKICTRLEVKEFLNLSFTCHFLHWRMFTFCTCYAPYTAHVSLADRRIEEFHEGGQQHEMLYDGLPLDLYHYSTEIPNNISSRVRDYWQSHQGLRGLFKTGFNAVKKPFLFEKIELELWLPFYNEEFFTKYWDDILALRKNCEEFVPMILVRAATETMAYDYSALNEFFKAVKATSYRTTDADLYYFYDDTEIYVNCPYTHQMKEVRVYFHQDELYPLFKFNNNVGFYENTPVHLALSNLKEILNGKAFEFHEYFYDSDDVTPSLPENVTEYLFNRYIEFDEYYNDKYGYIWQKNILQENGTILILKITRHQWDYRGWPDNWSYTSIAIGIEEKFNENWKKYKDLNFHINENNRDVDVKMETAVEGTADDN